MAFRPGKQAGHTAPADSPERPPNQPDADYPWSTRIFGSSTNNAVGMRLDRLALYLLLLFCHVRQDLAAQWRPPVPVELGPAEGLPAEVYDMAQDASGYIYFGTNTGLYRYDGHAFEYFGYSPADSAGIGRGDVYDVHVSRDGQIWLALRFGGLDRFDPMTKTFRHFPLPVSASTGTHGAHQIYEDPSGTLWIGGSQFCLSAFDPKTASFTVYRPDWLKAEDSPGRLNIVAIAPDPQEPDLLWLTVLDYTHSGSLVKSYGLVAFDKRTHAFTAAPAGGQSRVVDEDGIIWGTAWNNLISRFDPSTGKCDTFLHNIPTMNGWIRPLSRDILVHQGRLLVLSSATLMAFDRQTKKFEVVLQNPSSERLWLCLFVDRSGNVWIGTSEGALVVAPEARRIRFFALGMFGTTKRLYPAYVAYDPATDAVLLAHNNDTINKRIYTIPLASDAAQKPSFIPVKYPVTGLAVDSRRSIWVAGANALARWDPLAGRIQMDPLHGAKDRMFSNLRGLYANAGGWVIAEGSDEFIWFHADRRMIRRLPAASIPFSGGRGQRHIGINGSALGSGDLAYVYNREIVEVNLTTGQAGRLSYDRRINPDSGLIRSLAVGPSGDIWISTFAGIGRFIRAGDSLVMTDRFTVRDGLISPIQEDLHIDHTGRVWTFSASGMNAIDPVTREVQYFGTQEGLPLAYIDAVQALNLPDGRVVTVCGNGLIAFHPDSMWHAAAPRDIPVVVRRLRMSGQDVGLPAVTSPEKPFILGPSRQVVDLDVQALVYPTDYKVEYSYRIKGFQDEWIFIGRNRFITLPNLPHGPYVFEVKAGRPQSLSPVTALHILARAPIYERWTVRLALAAMLLLGVYWLFRRRMHAVRSKEREQAAISQRMAELELSALRSQMNPHFMFNSLNSIKNYILHAEPRIAAEYLSDFAHLIRMILQHSRERTISLADEIETLKLYVGLEQLRFDDAFAFSCDVASDLPATTIQIPPMLLQPYIENAIWHGLMHRDAPGRLALHFRRDGDYVLCVIDDNGIGREQAARLKSLSATRYKSMGMGLTRERIDILNRLASLGIQVSIIDKLTPDGQSDGTRVEVRLPIMQETDTSLNDDHQ